MEASLPQTVKDCTPTTDKGTNSVDFRVLLSALYASIDTHAILYNLFPCHCYPSNGFGNFCHAITLSLKLPPNTEHQVKFPLGYSYLSAIHTYLLPVKLLQAVTRYLPVVLGGLPFPHAITYSPQKTLQYRQYSFYMVYYLRRFHHTFQRNNVWSMIHMKRKLL